MPGRLSPEPFSPLSRLTPGPAEGGVTFVACRGRGAGGEGPNIPS